jgi:hypothetical protein
MVIFIDRPQGRSGVQSIMKSRLLTRFLAAGIAECATGAGGYLRERYD